jgi:hypothetical protein
MLPHGAPTSCAVGTLHLPTRMVLRGAWGMERARRVSASGRRTRPRAPAGGCGAECAAARRRPAERASGGGGGGGTAAGAAAAAASQGAPRRGLPLLPYHHDALALPVLVQDDVVAVPDGVRGHCGELRPRIGVVVGADCVGAMCGCSRRLGVCGGAGCVPLLCTRTRRPAACGPAARRVRRPAPAAIELPVRGVEGVEPGSSLGMGLAVLPARPRPTGLAGGVGELGPARTPLQQLHRPRMLSARWCAKPLRRPWRGRGRAFAGRRAGGGASGVSGGADLSPPPGLWLIRRSHGAAAPSRREAPAPTVAITDSTAPAHLERPHAPPSRAPARLNARPARAAARCGGAAAAGGRPRAPAHGVGRGACRCALRRRERLAEAAGHYVRPPRPTTQAKRKQQAPRQRKKGGRVQGGRRGRAVGRHSAAGAHAGGRRRDRQGGALTGIHREQSPGRVPS